MPRYIVQQHIVSYRSISHHTVPYFVPQHSAVGRALPQYTTLYRSIPYRLVPKHIAPYRIVYCIAAHCSMPFRAMSCRTVYHPAAYRAEQNIVPQHAVSYRISYRTVSYIVPQHVETCRVSHRSIPQHTVPYHTIPYSSAVQSSAPTTATNAQDSSSERGPQQIPIDPQKIPVPALRTRSRARKLQFKRGRDECERASEAAQAGNPKTLRHNQYPVRRAKTKKLKHAERPP